MNPDKVEFQYVDRSISLEMIKSGKIIELSMWHYPPPGTGPEDEDGFFDKYGKKTIQISMENFKKIWRQFSKFNFKKFSDIKKLKFVPAPPDANSGSVLTLIVDGKKIVDWIKEGSLDSKQAQPLKDLVQIPVGIYNRKFNSK